MKPDGTRQTLMNAVLAYTDAGPPERGLRKMSPAVLRTLAAAVVSPTAILHWTTGLTLLFAYAGARTLEQAQ